MVESIYANEIILRRRFERSTGNEISSEFPVAFPEPIFCMTSVSAEYQSKVLNSTQERRIYSDEEVREAFQSFDLDKNNYIGISELKHILAMIGERVTDDEVDEMIRLADTDGSGQVSFDGFYRLFGSKPSKSSIDISWSPTSNVVNQTQPILESASSPSATNDMTISQVLVELTKSIQITPVYIRTVYKQFQKYDVQKTGKVNYEDFLKVMQSEGNHLLRRLFDLLDVNMTGEVDEKVFLICLLMHAPSKIRINERVKISFSLLRAPGYSDTCIKQENLAKLLHIFFMCNEKAKDDIDFIVRTEGLIRDANSGSGLQLEEMVMTFDQFNQVLISHPETVLPSELISEISLDAQ
jgi:Ca2+-binding EF-hand superfamily protein